MKTYSKTYYYKDGKGFQSLSDLHKNFPNLIFSYRASDELLASIGITKKTFTYEIPDSDSDDIEENDSDNVEETASEEQE